MVKIQASKGRFSATIPKDIIEQAGLSKGDNVSVSFNERGNIEIRKITKRQ